MARRERTIVGPSAASVRGSMSVSLGQVLDAGQIRAKAGAIECDPRSQSREAEKGAGDPTPFSHCRFVMISPVSCAFAGLGRASFQATICAAWFSVANATGANTASAATRA